MLCILPPLVLSIVCAPLCLYIKYFRFHFCQHSLFSVFSFFFSSRSPIRQLQFKFGQIRVQHLRRFVRSLAFEEKFKWSIIAEFFGEKYQIGADAIGAVYVSCEFRYGNLSIAKCQMDSLPENWTWSLLALASTPFPRHISLENALRPSAKRDEALGFEFCLIKQQ